MGLLNKKSIICLYSAWLAVALTSCSGNQTVTFQIVFTTIPSTLAFIHLIFFLFYRKNKANLFFALCMLGFAVQVFCSFQIALSAGYRTVWLLQKIGLISVCLASASGLFASYWYIYRRLPAQAVLIAGLTMIMIAWILFFKSRMQEMVIYIFLGIGLVELIRIYFFKKPQSTRREWIVALGFIGLVVFSTYQILLNLHLLSPIGENTIVYVYGVLLLGLTVSVNLALDFARLNENLLLQERNSKENEIQQRLLQAEHDRKTEEIEEARKLQLSMLPKEVPDLPQLEISVYMRTATEVGGDYYDFKHFDDGSTVIALGDATGHGIKAGIMVTLIKSLFSSMGNVFYLPDFLIHCTKVIKSMSLGNLYMALLLARIRKNRITITSAGMPPVLLYRRQTGKIEDIELKALPLGAIENLDYQQIEFVLSSGDTMLLMSDGYAEQFNELQEVLDYDRVKNEFKNAAGCKGDEIINLLVAYGESWRKNQPQNDDITFMILKYK
jgi:serine phosphatase RsbU (regulator of sigma subunit)